MWINTTKLVAMHRSVDGKRRAPLPELSLLRSVEIAGRALHQTLLPTPFFTCECGGHELRNPRGCHMTVAAPDRLDFDPSHVQTRTMYGSEVGMYAMPVFKPALHLLSLQHSQPHGIAA